MPLSRRQNEVTAPVALCWSANVGRCDLCREHECIRRSATVDGECEATTPGTPSLAHLAWSTREIFAYGRDLISEELDVGSNPRTVLDVDQE